MPQLIDMTKILDYLTQCCEQYEQSAPTVHAYCDRLYVRIGDGEDVLLKEILIVQALSGDEGWLHPNLAANRIYHLQSDLGQDTAGQTGF